MSIELTSKQAVVYTRCSTEYLVIDGTSIQFLISTCRTFAEQHGITIKGVFIEGAKSGRSLEKREQIMKAFTMLEKGDIFLVYSLSRVARSIQDSVEIDKILKEKGSTIISATEHSMIQGKGAAFNRGILLLVAQYESEMIADRVRDSMKHRKEVLGTSNNKAHYGWKYDNKVKDGKRLIPVPIPDELKIVSIIKDLRNTKYRNPKYPKAKEQEFTPYKVIALHLNTSKIPTRSNKAGVETSEWHALTVKNILEYEANSITPEMEELRQLMYTNTTDDIIVYTGYVYILTSGTRKVGYADTLEKVYKQASIQGKKNTINIYRCKDQETLCSHFIAWLVGLNHIDVDNGDDIIREDANHDIIFEHIKLITKLEPICTTIIDIPKLFDK